MLGHEGVGRSRGSVGSKVKGLKVGDKVLLPFVDPDRKTCLGWAPAGALSEYAVVCDPSPLARAALPTAPLLRRCWTTIWTPWTPDEVLSNIRYFGSSPRTP